MAFAYAYDRLIDAHARLGNQIHRPNVSCADYDGWKLGRELYSKFHRVDSLDIEEMMLGIFDLDFI